MPILLFVVAGGMLFGGAALLDEANHQRAKNQARDRQKLEKELLAGAIELEELRVRAADLGLDPDQAVAGYEALRRGDISIQQVQQVLGIAS
jgi:hypothetical protein